MMLQRAFIRRCLSFNAAQQPSSKPFYITTPIFYVNAPPHIGHLYSAVIADATFRFEQLVGQHSAYHLVTGTDEHGTKIQQAAAAHGHSPGSYCDEITQRYQALFAAANVSCTDYMRTTQPRHHTAVQSFWSALQRSGSIYSARYSGWYCVPDETFLTETQLTQQPNGARVSSESGHPVEWTEEQNYMFRLSQYQDDLVHWLRTGERIRPAKFAKIVLDAVQREPLPDVSVSRPSARVHWGIRVPSDPSQTIYVWLDALVNYLTSAGYPDDRFRSTWPPNIQVIGKDIVKFHAIYWPAFLMAAGLEPPHKLHVHSHWTVNDAKMSKSKGNVIDPMERAHTYTMDGMRYFLLREGTAHSDGNYSETKLLRILNAELADTLGNLLSRGCARTVNVEQRWPEFSRKAFDEHLSGLDVAQRLVRSVEELPDKCYAHYKDGNFYLGIDAVMETLHAANTFFETQRPWDQRKRGEHAQLAATLCLTLETLRVCGIVLQPIVPELSAHLLDKLAVAATDRKWSDAYRLRWNAGEDVEQPSERPLDERTDAILFRRIRADDPKRARN